GVQNDMRHHLVQDGPAEEVEVYESFGAILMNIVDNGCRGRALLVQEHPRQQFRVVEVIEVGTDGSQLAQDRGTAAEPCQLATKVSWHEMHSLHRGLLMDRSHQGNAKARMRQRGAHALEYPDIVPGMDGGDMADVQGSRIARRQFE